MPRLRYLSTLVLAVALALPSGMVAAAEDVSAEPTTEPRLAQLGARFPTALRGMPLDANLRLAAGEELLAAIRPDEAALLEAMLDEHGKSSADYAAATSWLESPDKAISVIQAHRIVGVDAADTLDAWLDVLTLSLERPSVREDTVRGRRVTRISDRSTPERPALHLFAAGEVVWMVVTEEEGILAEAMTAVDPDHGEDDVTDADATAASESEA